VDFGDFRRLTRLGETAADRDGPGIADYFIERFLRENARCIRGRVLEIGGDPSTRAFGRDRAIWSDALDLVDDDIATIVSDPTGVPRVEPETYDCVMVTRALELVPDVHLALSDIYRVLKPGGTLLAAFPGLVQPGDEARRDSPARGFTSHSVDRLLTEVFPPSHVEVRARGNVLVATAFLVGLHANELSPEELEFDDPACQTLILAKAAKPDPFERFQMVGRWKYENRDQFAYDGEASYAKGLAFLDGHGAIEDWGCGTAYARRFVRKSEYIGIDGSESRFATRLADLQTYRSETDCIFMRHVLEHNHGWRLILENAVRSFRTRMVLILFTPFSEFERKIGDTSGIPDLSLRREDVIAFFEGLSFNEESFESDTQYGREHIFYIERP
jgi:SAM-dependent methyltransferase